jgi:Calcineurin-like phosphoesterase
VAAPANVTLPVLIVGDVHGDLERLFTALKPYPADRWRTIFLGDLVDYGMFGVGALRFARDRPNSTVILGNHEVAMLWALRDPQRVGYWMSIGGQPHDLAELQRDVSLQAWLHARPALIRLEDRTLVQHCGHDGYARWIAPGDETDPVDQVNRRVGELMSDENEAELWDVLSAKNVFEKQPLRLQSWLQATDSRRVVFGHTPHGQKKAAVFHDGLAINFDGGLSRSHRKFRSSPIEASVAPLDNVS